MKRVIAALDEAYARLAEADRRQHEPLAIVGMACRSALGDDPEQFWQALLSGRDGVSPIPPDRWTEAGTDAGEAIARREASLLRNVAEFDAAFFGITGREAVSMDPQQRLLLETAWQALEDAAIPREQFCASATGVFVGITSADYGWVMLRAVGLENLDGYSSAATALNTATGRLSYVLGLHGPSIAMDTACSSSLVSLHLACRSLRSGECSMALAGGVNLMLSALGMTLLSKSGMLSRTVGARFLTRLRMAMGVGRGAGLWC
jgi:myxalamid-type polyketide synthase MxaB